jgi:dihydropteroate synthase
MSILKCGNKSLDLSHAHVMGILNVTPDSFSDGGKVYQGNSLSVEAALMSAAEMVDDGATIIDIGGESTRPGAAPVSPDEELARVIPVIERISKELDIVISVDTSTPEVMREAALFGVGLINDVRSLAREGALNGAVNTGLPVCLMHMKGSPVDMQNMPSYSNVLEEVIGYLQAQVERCVAAGISREQIILDPGFGFGKTLEHNLQLLNRLDEFHQLGLPLLVGTSRKSMIGQALNRDVDQRLSGSLATVAMAIMKGAKIIRVHDVKETVDVVNMVQTVMNEGRG